MTKLYLTILCSSLCVNIAIANDTELLINVDGQHYREGEIELPNGDHFGGWNIQDEDRSDVDLKDRVFEVQTQRRIATPYSLQVSMEFKTKAKLSVEAFKSLDLGSEQELVRLFQQDHELFGFVEPYVIPPFGAAAIRRKSCCL